MEQQQLALNNDAKYYLYESGRWANFLGIVGFIACFFLVLVAVFIMSMPAVFQKVMPDMSSYAVPGGSAISLVFGLVYIVMAIVYFFPSLYLYQYGIKIKHSLNHDQQGDFVRALSDLKSLFKFWGVLTIIILSIYFLLLFLPLLTVVLGLANK